MRPHGAYIGATVGRFANRLGGARFSLNGKEYALAKNNGDNCLHGGLRGFNDYVWKAETPDDYTVRFSRLSPTGRKTSPGIWRSPSPSGSPRMAAASASHMRPCPTRTPWSI